MKKQNKPPPNLIALRQKAEALLKNEQAGSQLSFADTLKLIHELEVYQIELELQNTELMFANEQAEKAKIKAEKAAEAYAELFDFAPSGYFTLSNNGEIFTINLCGSQMLGKERDILIKSHLNFFVSEKTKPDFTHFLEKVFAGKTTEACDVTLNTNGQLPKFVHLTGVAYKNVEHCLVNAVDITALNLAVDKQRESEQKLISILDDVSDVVWSLSLPDLKVNFISPSVEKVFGRPVKEFAENTALWSEVVHPDDKHISDKAFEQLAKEGSAVRECRIIRPDGSIVWVSDKSKIICDKTGTPIRFDGVSRDITALKESEIALMESEENFRLIFENNSAAIAIIEPDTTISKVNDAYCQIGGFTKEEVIGKSWLEQIPPDDLERLKEYNRRRLIDPKDAPNKYEFSYYKKNAETGHAIVSVALLNNRKIIASFFDITERLKAEKDLYNSNKLLSSFMNHSPIFAFIKEVTPTESRVLKASENYIDMIGITGSEMVGKTMFNLFPTELAAKMTADDWAVVSEGKLLNLEEELNGHIYSSIKFPILQGDKNLLAGYSIDVTIQKQAEKKLKDSEQHAQALLKAIPDMMFLINRQGIFLDYKADNTDLFYQNESFIGKKNHDLVPHEFADLIDENINLTLQTGKMQIFEYQLQLPGRAMNQFEARMVPIGTDEVIVVARNVTERKKAELAILAQNEELEKLNTEKDKFFSIISHDLRSPFQALLGFSSMNPDELLTLPLEKIQKIALAMRTSANKLYNLLDNLLEWSQLQRGTISYSPYQIRLGEAIKEVVAIIRDAADKKMIEINWDIPDDLAVMADEQMFESLMRNLVFNAVKFTHKGGSITISAKQVEGNQVRISVKDNGIGMNQQMIDDIFTLDVKTTRPGTEGEPSTGLGLIICKEFVEKHGGKIFVESKENAGSVFSFTLPLK
jgi:PAS domain S-box-containing protein